MPPYAKVDYYMYKNPIFAVDVETTGLDPKKQDVIQVAILPLDRAYRPDKSYMPFNMHIKPMRPENATVRGVYKEKLNHAIVNGLDAFQAADLLDEWFDKLHLGNGVKITPLGHNYGFDKAFLEEWMGKLSYDRIFHYQYRDTMRTAIYLNDKATSNGDSLPYTRFSLNVVSKRHSVTNQQAHDALSDCVTTAEVYHRMMGY